MTHSSGLSKIRGAICAAAGCLIAAQVLIAFPGAGSAAAVAAEPTYPCEPDLIEVMFVPAAMVRLRGGALVDLGPAALTGVDEVLAASPGHEWQRLSSVSEAKLDAVQSEGEEKTGKPIYNLNNIYRLRISADLDVWEVSRRLEDLPGVLLARPVPQPQPLPLPGSYEPEQIYLDPSSAVPGGVNAEYAWTQAGGDGSGVTVCDIEYGWRYTHHDLTKAPGSQINPNPIYWPTGADQSHGAGAIGILIADHNSYGTTGICRGATLKTCGSYYGNPVAWNPAGAIAYAIASLSAGDVILLEQQWDYTGRDDYVPIELWTDSPATHQSFNAVYAAIQNAVAAGIHVVECGGNGGYNTDDIQWYGDSGAIVVGAGGAYAGGQYPEGELQWISCSSFGQRFDLQGQGENVVTTGYGDRYSAEGADYWYTRLYAGTSSAGAVVAGTVACCAGYWKANISSTTPPSPAYIRSLLVSTGEPQWVQWSWTPLIGPRPDLQAAFAAMTGSPAWTDVTKPPLDDAGPCAGVAWVDYEGDSDPDIYVANFWSYSPPAQENQMLRNDAGTFHDATTTVLGDLDQTTGMTWGDYDNDGDPDLFIANYNYDSTNRLLRNDGLGSFTDVTAAPLDSTGWYSRGAAWADYDTDGDLDLYVTHGWDVANKLFRNDGAAGFTDATAGPLGCTGDGGNCSWADYDNDGDPDLYFGNSAVEGKPSNRLLRNDGASGFTDVTSAAMIDTSWAGVPAWGDYDNDGDQDLFLASSNCHSKLLRNDGGDVFTDVTNGVLAIWAGTSAVWSDFDNDGDLDLYVTTWDWEGYPRPNQLLRNDGGGGFSDVTSGPLGDTRDSYAAASGDYDGDGDLDLYVGYSRTGNRLYRNNRITSGKQNRDGAHWLQIDLAGTASNASAIGAQVRLYAGGTMQMREVSSGQGSSQNATTVSFGLGSHVQVDSLQIRWPGGGTQTIEDLAADQRIQVQEETAGAVGDGGQARSFLRLENHPNPCAAFTRIAYDLPTPARVTLRIFDPAGRCVRTLAAGEWTPAGRQVVAWDARDDAGREVGSGHYWYRLQAGTRGGVRRLTVVR
ncbi:MAG: FG-GAP-like repeat-containing protein [Candidatus Eisenbacteria bacterium]